MSSQQERTAACVIDWERDRAVVREPQLGCNDELLDELIAKSDVVGIDAAFGWPILFTEAVQAWSFTHWNSDLRKRLCFRETDRAVSEELRRWPLSVSADRIALPAMRTFALLVRHRVTDRSGRQKFYEVYPAGSLIRWGLTSRGYKKDTDNDRQARKSILEGLCKAMPWLVVSQEFADTDHGLDALVSSLTVRDAKQGRTLSPRSEQTNFARREGWIHLPTDLPTL
jgi:hypothetical protein